MEVAQEISNLIWIVVQARHPMYCVFAPVLPGAPVLYRARL